MKGALPQSLSDLSLQSYYVPTNDPQSGKAYEYEKYEKVNDKAYRLCAEFNKDSKEETNAGGSRPYPYGSWTHPAGRHCFEQAVNQNVVPVKPFYPY